MSASNLYLPPAASLAVGETAPQGNGDAWRDGFLLVARRGGRLPDRCVKCNEPARGVRFRRTVRTGVFDQRSVSVEFGLCRGHRFRARLAVLSFFLAVVYGLFLIVWFQSPRWSLLGAVLILVGVVVVPLKFRSRTLTASRISDEFVWLKGAGLSYLDDLPSVPSSTALANTPTPDEPVACDDDSSL